MKIERHRKRYVSPNPSSSKVSQTQYADLVQKLQELIRRGTPRDLAAAQELMKTLAGAVSQSPSDRLLSMSTDRTHVFSFEMAEPRREARLQDTGPDGAQQTRIKGYPAE